MSAFDLNLASGSPTEEEDAANHAYSPLSSSNLFTNLRHQIPNLLHQLQQQEAPKEFLFIAGSSDHSIPHPHVSKEKEEDEEDRADKSMPSKMRFMRKMINSTHIMVSKPRALASVPPPKDQLQLQATNQGFNPTDNSPPSGVLRVCSDCNTTKTPLWRSGPCGPKSLCNACGIRQRKARRAMMALNGGVIPAHAPGRVRKEKKLDMDRTLPFKKRCKMNYTSNAAPAKKLCFDDDVMSSKKNVPKGFPQEERDAAILLMALSCGLINSQLSAC